MGIWDEFSCEPASKCGFCYPAPTKAPTKAPASTKAPTKAPAKAPASTKATTTAPTLKLCDQCKANRAENCYVSGVFAPPPSLKQPCEEATVCSPCYPPPVVISMELEMSFNDELKAEEVTLVEEGVQDQVAESLDLNKEYVDVDITKTPKSGIRRLLLAEEILYTVTITITLPATDDQAANESVESVVGSFASNPQSIADAVKETMETNPELKEIGGGFLDIQITKLAVEGAGDDSFVRTEEEIEELDTPTPPTPPSSAVSASCVHGLLMAFVCVVYML
jgi:hypothetical protein